MSANVLFPSMPKGKIYARNYGMTLPVDLLHGGNQTTMGAWDTQYTFTYPNSIPLALNDSRRGKTVKTSFAHYADGCIDILARWGKYLLGSTATLQEYNASVRRYEQGWIHMKQQVPKGLNQQYLDRNWHWITARETYEKYMTQLVEYGKEVALAQQKMTSANAAFEQAMSYYNELIDNENRVQKVADAQSAQTLWLGERAKNSDETIRWGQWKTALANDPRLRKVSEVRNIYYRLNDFTKAHINKLLAAQAKKEQKSYGELAVTTQMKTGLYSKAMSSQQMVTDAQIKEAAAVMDSYAFKLKPALAMEDEKEKALALYNAVVPAAKGFDAGVSLAVKQSAPYRAAVATYDNIVMKVEAMLKAQINKGLNWGVILGIGAAAVGAYAVLG